MSPLASRSVTTLACCAAFASAALAQKGNARAILPTIEQQVAAAISALPALPKEMRDSATVMGYRTRDSLEVIRQGSNGMICLALFALTKDFHVACYQDGLEPFMARGRQLRARGMPPDQVDTVRFAEIRSGKLKMPATGLTYQLFGDSTSFDPKSGAVSHVSQLMVLYMPFATEKSSGLSTHQSDTEPYLMYPGTPKAHMMLMGLMSPN